MNYRRTLVKGATYFFTVNLAERSNRLLVEKIDDLRQIVRNVRQRHPFEIVAWVVLPDHIHAIWQLPHDDADYSMRWNLIKANFSRAIPKNECIRDSRMKKGEREIWQRRFWEHLIRDEHDLQQHINYIHYNPVKHGYVQRAVDWEFSTFHQYVRNGLLDADWGCANEYENNFEE